MTTPVSNSGERFLYSSSPLVACADEASELDFQLAISDSHFEGFAADWRSWLAEITPTLICRCRPRGGDRGPYFAVGDAHRSTGS